MKRPLLIFISAIILLYLGFQLGSTNKLEEVAETKPASVQSKSNLPIVGYCWERARDINKGDLDSLYEYGGKWHNKKEPIQKPTKHYNVSPH